MKQALIEAVVISGQVRLTCNGCTVPRSETRAGWSHFFGFAVAPLDGGDRYALCRRCGSARRISATEIGQAVSVTYDMGKEAIA